jgi:hypothetical protein
MIPRKCTVAYYTQCCRRTNWRRGAACVINNPLLPNMKWRAAPAFVCRNCTRCDPALDTPVAAYNSAASLGRTTWKVLYAMIIRRKPPIHWVYLFLAPIYAIDVPELYAITGGLSRGMTLRIIRCGEDPGLTGRLSSTAFGNLPVLSRNLPRNRTLILSQPGSHDPWPHARNAGVNIAYNTLPCVFARLRLPPQVARIRNIGQDGRRPSMVMSLATVHLPVAASDRRQFSPRSDSDRPAAGSGDPF